MFLWSKWLLQIEASLSLSLFHPTNMAIRIWFLDGKKKDRDVCDLLSFAFLLGWCRQYLSDQKQNGE